MFSGLKKAILLYGGDMNLVLPFGQVRNLAATTHPGKRKRRWTKVRLDSLLCPSRTRIRAPSDSDGPIRFSNSARHPEHLKKGIKHSDSLTAPADTPIGQATTYLEPAVSLLPDLWGLREDLSSDTIMDRGN